MLVFLGVLAMVCGFGPFFYSYDGPVWLQALSGLAVVGGGLTYAGWRASGETFSASDPDQPAARSSPPSESLWSPPPPR